ncbi:MAG: transglutaminase-like domain-containing protein [Elusimicrobia bacterium]|nr:transglutaminase-like domain-containing protein [Elusimicrobiota bacterium]
MKAFSETELRSLVSLLDEDDPQNLDRIQRDILEVGAPAIPYLDELRGRGGPDVTARADALARRLHFHGLQQEFRKLAAAPAPDLEDGVWLLARFGYPEVDPAEYRGRLDALADQVRQALPADAPPAQALQKLSSQLFAVMGFCGNEKHYYDPDNSFLNRVLEDRRGIPVSLSALYLLVGRRLGLPVYGVATPGHFLVGVRLGAETSYLDAYNRGRAMTLADVQHMLSRSGYEFRPEFVAPAGARDILARMMRNLISIYQKAAQAERAEMLSSLVDILVGARPAPAAPLEP